MSSALTRRGSTRRWRTIRHAYAQQLAYLGTVPCWRAQTNDRADHKPGLPTVDQSPDCTGTIVNGQAWVLGHKTDRAAGGDDTNLGYECDPCSRHTGGKTGARIRARRANPRRRTW